MMKRRLLAIAGAGALMISAVGLLTTGSASAEPPDQQGWWWRGKMAALPVGVPTPPNAPADGLFVASDSTGADAVSAVRFTIPDGATTGSLKLNVSGNTLGTPALGLCRVTGPWQPAQGGNWEAKPAVSETGCAPGTMAADGKSVTFATSSLVSGGLLDVAVVPVKDASGNQPTFQVGFNKPDETTLTVTPAPSASSFESFSSEPAPASQPSTATSPTPSSSSSSGTAPASSSRPSFTSTAPSPTVAPAVDDSSSSVSSSDPQGAELTASPPSRQVARPVVTTSNNNNRKYQTIGIIGLALLALFYTTMNNRPARAARALVTFGQGDDSDAVPQGGSA